MDLKKVLMIFTGKCLTFPQNMHHHKIKNCGCKKLSHCNGKLPCKNSSLFINYEKYKKIDLIYSTSKLVAEFSQSAQKLNFPMKILLKKF